MEDTIVNPYVPPSELTDAVSDELTSLEIKQTTIASALGRWGLVCVVSAAPSFFYGLIVSEHVLAIPVMVSGVAVFTVGYALVDISPLWRRWMSHQIMRGCIMAAYGIRILISILFPVGCMNDMLMGILSINAVAMLFRSFDMADQLTNPVQIFLTTIMQGVLLNCEVVLLAVLLVGCTYAVRGVQRVMRS